jgi:hypothetical protein
MAPVRFSRTSIHSVSFTGSKAWQTNVHPVPRNGLMRTFVPCGIPHHSVVRTNLGGGILTERRLFTEPKVAEAEGDQRQPLSLDQ